MSSDDLLLDRMRQALDQGWTITRQNSRWCAHRDPDRFVWSSDSSDFWEFLINLNIAERQRQLEAQIKATKEHA